MSKICIPDPDVAASGWLSWPEECLRLKYPDYTSLLPRRRLEALCRGEEHPYTNTEKDLDR